MRAEFRRRRPALRAPRVAAALVVIAAVAACGKKGPPRPPLNLVPDPPQAVTGRRLGDTEFLQMTVPARNANGPGPVAVQRLDIYAASVAADVPVPANKDLLKPAYLIGHIDVRPPVDPDAPPEDTPDTDTRPRPGDVVAFAETRDAAIARLERALAETVVEGVHTTIPLCLEILASHRFRSGHYDIGFLPAMLSSAV